MKELVALVVKSLVRDEAGVTITETPRESDVLIEVTVAKDDLGRVIGRHGKTARALRTLISHAPAAAGQAYALEIVEPKP